MSFQYAISKDKDFREQYDAFRFGLYSYIDAEGEFKITPEMTTSIKSFLEEYESEIVKHRIHQLERYEREDPTSMDRYEKIDKDYLEELREMAVMLNPEKLFDQMDSDVAMKNENIGAVQLVKLFSVEPVALTNTIVGQLSYMILNQHLEMTTTEITQYYTGMAIGGQFVSTRQIDKNNWEIKLNAHKIIYAFSFNTFDGKLSMDEIWTRVN